MKNMANKFLVITATHGDENLGVNVMKKLEKDLSPKMYNYDWIIGNPEAYKKGIRFIQADLNRVAPGSLKSKIYEERQAAEIMRRSSKYKFIVDVHSTVSNSGIVTIIPYPSLENLFLASFFNIKKNIIWYSKDSLKKGPLVQFANCPGIEIECGPKTSHKLQTELEDILKKFIKKIKSGSVIETVNAVKNKEFYSVYGKRLGNHDSSFRDFHPVNENNEVYFPFLSNQYSGIICYKTKKVSTETYFLTDYA